MDNASTQAAPAATTPATKPSPIIATATAAPKVASATVPPDFSGIPAGTKKDLTKPIEIVSKISFTPEEAAAFLAAIDPGAPAGKTARIFAAHVGPKGELSFTIYYQP